MIQKGPTYKYSDPYTTWYTKAVGSSFVAQASPSRVYHAMKKLPTIDDIIPALPIKMNVPLFPWFRVLKVMQDLYHQR